jgi:hypothetical protein
MYSLLVASFSLAYPNNQGCNTLDFESTPKTSMGMSFFAMPSHRSEQWAFQNGAHRLLP